MDTINRFLKQFTICEAYFGGTKVTSFGGWVWGYYYTEGIIGHLPEKLKGGMGQYCESWYLISHMVYLRF